MTAASDENPPKGPYHSVLMTARRANALRNLLAVMASCVDAIHARVPAGAEIDDELVQLARALRDAFQISGEMVDTGLPSPSEHPINDLNEVIAQSQGILKRAIGDDIALRLRLKATACYVSADALELEMMLLNLAMNARDAMPQGGFLTIETASPTPESPSESHGYVRLTVSDTSRVMEPHVGQSGFDPFARIEDERSLGRVSVAIAIRMLRGRLHVDSVQDVGTTIHIDLPTLRSA